MGYTDDMIVDMVGRGVLGILDQNGLVIHWDTPDKEPPAGHFRVGDKVNKTGGDYTFTGEVIAVFKKKSGQWRAVVENAEGILHIFNLKQLALIEAEK